MVAAPVDAGDVMAVVQFASRGVSNNYRRRPNGVLPTNGAP
jgi:hypothetical protein